MKNQQKLVLQQLEEKLTKKESNSRKVVWCGGE